jgi:hypothetical protein
LAVGSLLAVAGAAAAARAHRDAGAYGHAPLGTPDEIDAAHALHDRAEHRARAARGLLGSAGALAVAGVAALLWKHVASERAPRSVTALRALDATPVAGGVLVSFRGAIGGTP